ncbi:TPA: hypothetical protein PBT65_001731 [Staphylococcus aureus]|nr:hypothetical protein [Staphylococcus aureus]
MSAYIVKDKSGQIIIKGKILSEIIEYIFSNQINNIDQRYSTLTKIENNIYQYLNQLSSIYSVASEYAKAIETAPCCLKTILDVYNQDEYISLEEFIDIQFEMEEN